MLNLQALVIVRNIVGRSDRDFAGVKTLYSIILLIGDRISACNQAIGGISMIIRGDAVNGDQIAFLFAGIAGPIGLGVFLGLRAAGVVAFVRMVAAVNGAVAVCVMIVHALVADVAEAVFVLINTNVLPDRVEVGDLGGCCNRIAAFDRDSRIVRIPIPAEEFVAVSSWLLAGNGERHLAGVGLFSLRSRYTIFIAAVGVVVQGVGDLRVGILRNQIDRRALVASRRVFQVEAPSLRVRICFLAPANDLIAAVHRRSVRSRLDIADGDRVVVVGRVAVRRRILAYKLRLFRCAGIVADAELIADIKNGESYIDLMAGIQCLRTDTVVSC